VIFDGKDVIIQSQTGSGKTLAYCLPIVSRIDATRSAIQAVIIVPTRELGLQVTAVLKQLSHGAPEKIMIMSVVEGSKNRRWVESISWHTHTRTYCACCLVGDVLTDVHNEHTWMHVFTVT